MSTTYDVAVVGLGGMGSAALAECASRGARSIGIDALPRGHTLGASSGKSRIVRQAYYEHPAYVPLLLRAYERWRALEGASGERLLELCGLLMVGRAQSEVIAGALRAARSHDLDVAEWTAAEIRRRYPDLIVRNDEVGVFEPLGGFVRPESAIAAFLGVAERAGATLAFDLPMRGWSADSDCVRIDLVDGSSVRAARLVLALGPWFASELAKAGVPLLVQRNVQAWFAPLGRAYDFGVFPVFLLDRAGMPAPLYGFPDAGDGVKAAFHGDGATVTPVNVDRSIDPACDIEPLAIALSAWMPGAAGALLDAKACLYALTPDADFAIDLHPEYDNVVLCGGFSGHGFKFASVVGEIAADLALRGGTAHDIGFLSLRRFSRGAAAADARIQGE